MKKLGLVVATVVLAGCGLFGSKDKPGSFGSSCAASAECDAPYVCTAGACLSPGMTTVGGGCWASRDCMAGLYCTAAGRCDTAGTGAVGALCTTDGQCGSGLRCVLDGFSGSCGMAGKVEPGGMCTMATDCLSGLFCGSNQKCEALPQAFPPYAGVMCQPDTGPFRAYFEVPRPGKPPADFYRLPFPNDVRVQAGKLDMSDFPKPGPTPLGVDLVGLYVDSWVNDFEGFGSTPSVTFRFSGSVDFATTMTNVQLVDLTAKQTLGIAWSFTEGRTKYSCPDLFYIGHFKLDTPFRPGHVIGALILSGVKSKAGELAAQDTDFAAVMAATRPTGDDALGHAWDAYQPLRDYLPSASLTADKLAGAAVFTVADSAGHMRKLAAAAAAQPAPTLSALTLCAAGTVSPCDDGTPARACPASPDAAFSEIHGKIKLPIFQIGTPPYETPTQGGEINEVAGVPTVVRSEDVCFALSIPKGAAMPASGWPLMVYHHGTGGSFRTFIDDGIAAHMASAPKPVAVMSFDAVNHGARRGTSMRSPNELVFNPLNPRAARDNFLQGGVNILTALRLSEVMVPAAGSPTGAALAFDPAQRTFFGHSQGSTSGALAIAFTDAAPAVIFSGAGAHLTDSLLNKTSPIDVAAGMQFLIGDTLDGGHPTMVLFQSYFERSDPINYNQLIIREPPTGLHPKHVFMSLGTGDTYAPKPTLEANAESLGLSPVNPVLDDYGAPGIARPISKNFSAPGGTVTAACFEYDPPAGTDGHFVINDNPTGLADWQAFINSYYATGTPTVP